MTPPYYAVIFTSKHKEHSDDYDSMGARMFQLTQQQPGFLGINSARNDDGSGITVCYWDSLEAIKNWKENAEHENAQHLGKTEWYAHYSVRIAKVEREYSMEEV